MNFHFNTLNDDITCLSQSWASRKALLCRDGYYPLWVHLLTPGFTNGYHQQVLSISGVTVATFLARARAAQGTDPSITDAVAANVVSISPYDGLLMAQRRGSAHLPLWSRLALCHYYRELGSANKVAELFSISPATAHNVLKHGAGGFDLLSSERRLAPQQLSPSGQWQKGNSALISQRRI